MFRLWNKAPILYRALSATTALLVLFLFLSWGLFPRHPDADLDLDLDFDCGSEDCGSGDSELDIGDLTTGRSGARIAPVLLFSVISFLAVHYKRRNGHLSSTSSATRAVRHGVAAVDGIEVPDSSKIRKD